jgi:hypothetical protein
MRRRKNVGAIFCSGQRETALTLALSKPGVGVILF